ncbi:MAG TPA: copper amine oxidase [Selenomonas sp.]|nr:copper amine oxidase [Selenomonas sp.]
MTGFNNKIILCAVVSVLSCLLCQCNGAEARHGNSEGMTKVVTDIRDTELRNHENAYEAGADYSRERLGSDGPNAYRMENSYNGKDFGQYDNTMKLWKVNSKNDGGTLLFSDSPEYVHEDGILYSDTVSGDARILYYHLNNTDKPKKVAVVLENVSGKQNEVKITRGGMGDPSNDYLKVGKSTQAEYFKTKLDASIRMEPWSEQLLQDEMDRVVLEPGELIYGVYDFSTKNPVKVSVIMYPASANPVSFLHRASVLPKDEQRLRGTFKGMNRTLSSKKSYDPSKDGVVYFPIGDDEHDLFLKGIDATDGSQVVNYGNYGVLYNINIPTKGKKKTSYYLSPRGGVYAGAMTVKQGKGKSNLLLTPRHRAYFGDVAIGGYSAEMENRDMAFLSWYPEMTELGTYKNNSKLSFEYSPPGASNLPVHIILMPERS